MIFAKYFLFITILVYLCVQSYSDVKTMRVYAFLNNLAMILSGAALIIGYVFTGTLPNTMVLPGILCILLFLIFKVYGMGDIKAMVSIFFSSAYFDSGFSQPDSFAFLMGLLIGNVLFFIIWKTYKAVTKSDRKKAAFFPFLVISHIATFVICQL